MGMMDDTEVMKAMASVDSQKATGQVPGAAYPMDVKHINNPDKLNSIADQSHADHKASTGQVPNVDPEDQGYTTYQHKGAYYQPGEGD